MRRAIFIAVGLAVGAAGVLAAQSVQQMPAQGYLPETITIRRSVADTARVCVEPATGGLVSCRTMKELRVWIQARDVK
mgnify:FL=1